MTPAVAAAIERADYDASRRPWRFGSVDGRPRERRLAVGDPQAPFEKLLEILDRHGALGPDGRVVPTVQLVSMGDHFDWSGPLEEARRDALRTLAWLAAHSRDQVVILIGNHDLGRVGELAGFDDARFSTARSAAEAIYVRGEGTDPRADMVFRAEHGLVTAEVAARDLSSWCETHSRIVEQMLSESRFVVAHAVERDFLLCHAGVTRDDLLAKGLGEDDLDDATRIAQVLDDALSHAFAAWDRRPPFAIPDLHRPGLPTQGEGRGIFFHRPSNPNGSDRKEPELFSGPLRRRFDPRDLPRRLTQAIGHILDAKCRKLLSPWCEGAPARRGELRHLVTDGTEVRYQRGTPRARSEKGDATLIFTDGGMLRTPANDYELLDLGTRRAARP